MRQQVIDIDKAALILRSLANPARLKIVLHLLTGEQSVAALEAALRIRQPNLSQHLADLRDAGLVVARRDSRAMIYALADEDQRRLVASLVRGFGGSPSPVEPEIQEVPHRRAPNRQVAMFAVVTGRD
jgi:DNA-binding transcriptional ArsR family regulator